MTTADRVWHVFAREVRAAARSRSYLALGLVTVVAVFGVAIAGGGPTGGYVPTVVDVLVVVELLVPAVAFAIGYRALSDPISRGELDVLETYPLPIWGYVGGTYAGRAVILVAVVGVPLAALGVHVATTAGPETTVFASHRGVDSPLLYLRFLAITLVYGLVSLSLAVLLSVLAGSRSRALVLSLAGLLVLTVGGDVAVFAALDGGILTSESLGGALSVTPAGAYRGLVFDQVLYVAVPIRSSFVPGWLATVALGGWWVSTLVGAAAVAQLR
ncbi:ABC transporter permease [Haloarcula halophila]|uniref:ABC transporter permease n=1 Tax=Haloarcula TaxID=2237 RepID=UPI0023E42E39|nr:ABC transporter permease subunit [Halomicroarcula sp. DFY41]